MAENKCTVVYATIKKKKYYNNAMTKYKLNGDRCKAHLIIKKHADTCMYISY